MGGQPAHSDVCPALSKHRVLPTIQAPGLGKSSGPHSHTISWRTGRGRTLGSDWMALGCAGPLTPSPALHGGRLGRGGTSCVVSDKLLPLWSSVSLGGDSGGGRTSRARERWLTLVFTPEFSSQPPPEAPSPHLLTL